MTTFKARFLSFNFTFAAICLSIFLSFGASLQAQTLLAGSVSGQFSVNQNGAATYTLPIQVPPGVTGMQPQLSLNYNSQDGHGLAGVGWSLGGLSVITRCEQTLAQEGVRNVVNLDDNDRYCLEGQKLMRVAGAAYAQDGAEYRTESDKFSKIISYGRSGLGATWFKAWTKSGQIMEFGNTLDSRVIGSGYATARQWSLNRVTDVNGNTMTISYLNSADRTTHLPEIISYGGNTTTATVANRSVLIVYAVRPDVTSSFIADQKLVESSRISKITTKIGTTAVKNYNFTYEISPSTKRSRLTKVDECDGLGTSCLKPLLFAYNDMTQAAVNQAVGGHGLGDAGKRLVDLFGDGRPVYYTHDTAGTHYATRINADSTVQNWKWVGGHGVGNAGWDIADLFGDGRPVYWTHDTAGNHYASRLNSDETVVNFNWAGGDVDDGIPGNGKIVDLFGDGKPVYYTRHSDNHYATRLSPVSNVLEKWQWLDTGMKDCGGDGNLYSGLNDSFGDGKLVFWMRCGDYWGTHSVIRFNKDNTVSRTNWDLGDALGLNANLGPEAIHAGGGLVDAYGDGHPVVWSRTGDSSALHVITQLNNDGTRVTRTFTGFDNPDVPYWTFADIFGDGHKVYWSVQGGTHKAIRFNRDGTSQKWEWPGGFGVNPDGWRLADLFGDGRQVFWTRSGSNHYVTRLNPDSLIPENYTFAGHGTGANGWDMADLLGDGRQVYWTQTAGTHFVTSFSRGEFDNLKTVTGSTGLKQTPTYTSINQSTAIYASDRGTASAAVFPQKDIQFPMRVVTRVDSDTGLGGTSSTVYSYGGLKSDQITGRGFLGFRWMGSKDLSTNIETMSVFHQTWPYVGMLKNSETRLAGAGNGGLLKRSSVTPGCKIPLTQAACAAFPAVNPPGTLYFPHTSQSVDESWDLNGAAFPVVTTSYQYNLTAGDSQLYGNPTQITAVTNLGLISKTVNTVNEYFPANTTAWVLGRLKKSTVTNTATDSNITTGNPILPLPTISVVRTPMPMLSGQNATATWNATNTNSLTYNCTSTGTGYVGSGSVAVSGGAAVVANAAWVGYPSTCTWTAVGQGGTSTFVETLTTIHSPPTITVTRTPLPLIAGQSYNTTWNSTFATAVNVNCTSTGTGFAGSGAQTLSGNTTSAAASAAWVGYPTSCTWTATGPGGTATASDNFSTIAIPKIPVYRVRYDLRYMLTVNVAERDWVINNWGAVYEGVAFYAYAQNSVPGLQPVNRYRNTSNSTYFYTNNAAEIASMGNYQQYVYEGVAWYAQENNSANGAIPLYRFIWYDTNNEMYFYTTTQSEGANSSYSIPDGASQYVWPAP